MHLEQQITVNQLQAGKGILPKKFSIFHGAHQLTPCTKCFTGQVKLCKKMWLQSLRKVDLQDFNRALRRFLIQTKVPGKNRSTPAKHICEAGDFEMLFFLSLPPSECFPQLAAA